MGVAGLVNRVRLPYVSQWINDDVRPIESARRTWGYQSFHNVWLLINCNISTFLSGSALIPLGLNYWQAIICIILGNIIATVVLIANSMAGAQYHVGFPILSRAAWGMWGSQFAIWNRIFLSIVWYGFQSWVGGQCFYLIMLSWDTRLEQHIPNRMPTDTAMTTAQFVAYIVFFVISLPFIYIRPHKLRWFLQVTSAGAIIFFLSFLIWALATMGKGGFGDTISNQTQIPATGGPMSTAWLMVYGIISTVGAIAAGLLNNNDYTRLARKPRHALWGQAIPFPFYAIVSSIFGILVVAATQERLGGPEWNPPTILTRLLVMDPGAGTRAAVFFGGLALCLSQLGDNVPGNALAGGIDLASVFPRYINIRRGAYITAILSPIVNPWRLVGTATTFLSVVSGYGVFLAPMTGLMVANYWIINRRKLDIDSLYRGNSSSIYWYSGGVNWRAPIAWVIGVAPCLPGFIATVNTKVKVSDGAIELYYMSYLYGFVVSGAVYTALHRLFPVKEIDNFVNDGRTAAEVQSHFTDRWETDTHDGVQMVGADIGYATAEHFEKHRGGHVGSEEGSR